MDECELIRPEFSLIDGPSVLTVTMRLGDGIEFTHTVQKSDIVDGWQAIERTVAAYRTEKGKK